MKRLISTIFTLLFPMFFFLPFSALGQDKPKTWIYGHNYIAAKAGAYFPTGDLDDLDFDTGFNGEIVYGYRFNPNFALEGGVGYFQSNSEVSGTITDPVIGTVTGTVDMDLWTVPVTVTAKGIYPIDNVELFAGAGIGLYFVNLDLDASGTISGGALGTISGTISTDDDDTIFGGHILAGANVNITPNVFIGIEGKYIITDEAEFFGVKFSELDGFILTGNIGIRF